ncbi:hypothetical protein IC230_21165 [Spirosoma sp. BT704]|uniref:HMA domain-containing protein n=2 Tax=Spirosoma validum TaxID=2771355 RepID=A0A927GF71_9BACT|nr:hypothetical protein [Spirosoma validum]
MVEVFKTNVQEVAISTMLIQKLLDRFKADKISFDLEDCDKVLRVEGDNFSPDEIIESVNSFGYNCEILAY